MRGAIRSEFRKFLTTRTWWGMAIPIALLGAAFAVLFAFTLTAGYTPAEREARGIPGGTEVQIANSVYGGGLTLGIVLLLVVGVLQIGQEYRHKTITGTFLASPRRIRPMMAKVVALLGIGAGYGVLSVACSVIAGALTLQARGVDPFPSAEILRTLALCLLALGLWGLIGLGLGILIPNQVAAILVGVGVAMVVEPIVGSVLQVWEFTRDFVAPYLPQAATSAMIDSVQNPGATALEWWQGGLVLGVYAVVLSGLGTLRVLRQDIS